ncbi:MAG: ABC transporter ATP-binding protein [Dactylosporangium sp.]|nr:energy-coupling factor ABC transporter ATP-binding protein [Dactylosporangium sp.]NNJ60504.1 ABC transporter ATP-binding protein [Dactylosporangium sp.]
MIEIERVSHRFIDRTVLRDVTVTLAEHRIGVIGANGSGKSTFARLINGLVRPSEGRVSVDGLDTRRDAGKIRRKVGFVFTDPDNQIVMPTVAEDVAFSLRRAKLPREEVRRRVTAALERFGLSDHADHPAHLLSGGQKQMLALAAVLATEPTTVVCDEPTTLLDLRNTRMVGTLLHQLPQRVVLVTHQLDLLDGYDRVLVFDDGRLVVDDRPGPAVAAYRRLMT